MKCETCSADINENAICKSCFDNVRANLVKSLEEFIDTNYPPSQYKIFNARIKAKIKELAEGNQGQNQGQLTR